MSKWLTIGLVIVVAALFSDPPHRDATWLLAHGYQEQGPLPPPPDIEPSDAKRPWHRGSIHFGCSRTGEGHDGHESDAQVRQWHKCTCQHPCTDPKNAETGGRK